MTALTVAQFATQLGVDADDVIEAAAWTADIHDPAHVETDETGTDVWVGDLLTPAHQHAAAHFLRHPACGCETCTEAVEHTTTIERLPVAHGYPHQAACTCGWRSDTWAAPHAAQQMADDHLEQVAR